MVSTSTKPRFVTGQAVEVHWDGKWRPGKIARCWSDGADVTTSLGQWYFQWDSIRRDEELVNMAIDENGELLERLETFAKEQGASVAVIGDLIVPKETDPYYEWSVSIVWGRESPNSEMAGAHAIGADTFLKEAIEQALTEAGA
jgi:hypothetical protein